MTAKGQGINKSNARNSVNNSTRRLSGWNTTYAPKNKSVKVLDWLRDNNFHVFEREKDLIGNQTFGNYRFDGAHDALDTFIRDAIYDGVQSLKRKR